MLTLDELKKLYNDACLLEFCNPVLNDSRLGIWPLELNDSTHHSCLGGLLTHLYEVVSSGILMCSLYINYCQVPINVKEFLIGATWHYYGKFLSFLPKDETHETWIYNTTFASYETQSIISFTKHFLQLQEQSEESLEKVHDISFEKIIGVINQSEPYSRESQLLKSMIEMSKRLHT